MFKLIPCLVLLVSTSLFADQYTFNVVLKNKKGVVIKCSVIQNLDEKSHESFWDCDDNEFTMDTDYKYSSGKTYIDLKIGPGEFRDFLFRKFDMKIEVEKAPILTITYLKRDGYFITEIPNKSIVFKGASKGFKAIDIYTTT